MADHGVLLPPGDVVPMPEDVLRIEEAVLPTHGDFRMGKEFVEREYHHTFFFSAEVVLVQATTREGDANSLAS